MLSMSKQKALSLCEAAACPMSSPPFPKPQVILDLQAHKQSISGNPAGNGLFIVIQPERLSGVEVISIVSFIL